MGVQGVEDGAESPAAREQGLSDVSLEGDGAAAGNCGGDAAERVSRELVGRAAGGGGGEHEAPLLGANEPARGGACARALPVWLTPCTLTTAVLLLVCGAAASGVLYWALDRADEEAAHGAAGARAALVEQSLQDCTSRIQQSLDSARLACEGLVALFDAPFAEWPSQRQFSRTAASLFAGVPGMAFFLWAPRVELADTAQYSNLSDAYWGNVWPQDAANYSASGAARPWFPLRNEPRSSSGARMFNFSYYIMLRYPDMARVTANANVDALGFGASRNLMLEALATGKMAATDRAFLTDARKFGIVLITPTRNATAATAQQGGFLGGGGVLRAKFALNEMVVQPLQAEMGRKAFLSASNAGFDLWLHDVTPVDVPAAPIPGYAPGQFLTGFSWDGARVLLKEPDDRLPAACTALFPNQTACSAAYAGLTLDAVRRSPAFLAAGAQVAQTNLTYAARTWTLSLVPRAQMFGLALVEEPGASGKVLAVVLCSIIFALLAAFVLLAAHRSHRTEQRRLSEALKAQQQAMNYMCHELRNPIHVIRFLTGEVTNIMHDLADAHGLEMINLLQAYTSSLYYMVNGFLDLAKAGHASISISKSPLHLAELVANSFQVYSTLNVRPAQLVYRLHIAPELSRETFFFDAVRIEQVLANGLSNAAKYTKAGSITVSARIVAALATCSDDKSSSSNVNNNNKAAGKQLSRKRSENLLAAGAGSGSSVGGGSVVGGSVFGGSVVGRWSRSLGRGKTATDAASATLSSAESSCSDDSTISVDATRTVRITVADTGVGIDGIDPESVFQDFAQSTNKQVVQQASTGLGLPIARKLARMMGGDVRLEPNPLEHGTCFIFDLPFVTLVAPAAAETRAELDPPFVAPAAAETPAETPAEQDRSDSESSLSPALPASLAEESVAVAATAQAPAAPAVAPAGTTATAAAAPAAPPQAPAKAAPAPVDAVAAPAPRKPLSGLCVVAVEDEPATHMILKRMLEKGGAEEIKMFFEGSEMTRQYRAKPAQFDNVDIYLVDMHMTYTDGLSTVKSLREAGCTKPCIAVTGAASEDEAKAYVAGGFAAVCAKPYTAEQLFGHVHSVLRAHRKKDRTAQDRTSSPDIVVL